MKRIQKLTSKLFSGSNENKFGEGLYASLEELISQKKYTKYINYFNHKKAYSQMSGDAKSVFKGRGIEFEEIREYTFGDEVRDIDWRVTARKTTPYTKIYNEERNREIYAFLDLSSSMVFGTKTELKSVLASKIAALLAWVCLENKDKFGCVIFDGRETFLFKPKNYRENVLAILKKISEINQKIITNEESKKEVSPFEKAIQHLQSFIKIRSTVFIISDFSDFGEKVRKNLAILSNKNDVYLIDIFDRIEELVPKDGEYMVGHEGQSLVFDTRDGNFKQKYEKLFVYKREYVKNFCLKFSCGYFQAITGVPAFKQIKI